MSVSSGTKAIYSTEQKFRQWAELFSEKLFVILKVYADESTTPGEKGKRKGPEFAVLGGYIAQQEEWVAFTARWRAVLGHYHVKNFHFREFNSKADCAKKDSPYFGWNDQKRDDFFYDLGMAIASRRLVPIGGDYQIKKHRETGALGDPIKWLFSQFFGDTRQALDAHWPGFTDRVLFIFDKGGSKKWQEALHEMHDFFSGEDKRIGGLTFEDDTDPKHLGLQAADFLSALYRQSAEAKAKSGALQKYRIIDVIIFRHMRQSNTAGMHPLAFKLMIDEFRKDEKRQKREWESQGLTGMKYYPTEHFPWEKHGVKRA